MSTYGTRDATRFKINGVQYYTLIESAGPNKGQITIKSPTVLGNAGGANADRTVGIIPLDNAFKPTPGNATTGEVAYFSSAAGQKAVKNQAVITAQKAGAPNPRQLIFPNTASGGGTNAGITTTGGDQQGGNPGGGDPSSPPDDDSSTSQPIVDLTKLEKINPGYVRTTYGDPMRYPLTMNTDNDKNVVKQDVIKFQMFEYNPAYKFSQGEEGSSFAKSSQKKSLRGTVILPIQPTIVDSNSVNWQEDSIDPLVLAAIDASTGFIEGGTGGLDNAISGVIKKLGAEGNDNLGNALKAAAVSMATGKNIFTRTTGAILNPNMELLFNGPSLRQFSYSFNLSARSAPESRAIRKIIRFFKQGMSVQRSAGELFLVTPDIFQIQYLLKEGADHPYINRIKTCALTNCSVDYTPTGSYMTFNDGAMVSYTLNLSFEELEPIYHDDYEPLGEDVIGY
jgi:hypothetical protein